MTTEAAAKPATQPAETPPVEAAKPSRFKEFLSSASDAEKQEMAGWAKPLYQPDIDKLQAQVGSLRGRTWEKASAEEKEAIGAAWRELFEAKDVPADIFEGDAEGEYEKDPRIIKRLGERYLKAISIANARATKMVAAEDGGKEGPDMQARIKALEQKAGPSNEKMIPAAGSNTTSVEVTADNIDLLNRQGIVSDDDYRVFLRTGKLPGRK